MIKEKFVKKLILILSMSCGVFAYADNRTGFTAGQLGVGRVGISEAEYQQLLSFVTSTRLDLEQLQKDTIYKPTTVALQAYIETMTRILENARGGTKLIMATPLAHGLDLVHGLPTSLTGGTRVEPALNHEVHLQLQLAVLKASVFLAKKYYFGQIDALQNEILINPPYKRMAVDIFEQSILFWPAVMDARSSVRYMQVSLFHVIDLLRKRPDDKKALAKVYTKWHEFQTYTQSLLESPAGTNLDSEIVRPRGIKDQVKEIRLALGQILTDLEKNK